MPILLNIFHSVYVWLQVISYHVTFREGGTELIQLMHEHSQDSSHDSTQGGVMTELASLVQGSGFRHNSPHEIHDCRPYIRNFQAHR
jgi:hypothetical protein